MKRNTVLFNRINGEKVKLETFLEHMGWKYACHTCGYYDIHLIYNKNTYHKDNKLYNIITATQRGDEWKFVIHNNPLKVYHCTGGYYVNIEQRKVWVNGIIKNKGGIK